MTLLPTAALVLMTAIAAAQEPAAGQTPPNDPTKAIQPLGGNRYRLGLMEFDKETRTLSLPATVNMTKGLLEYVLVHESGKVHEALLSTKVKPAEFNVALLLLHWKPSTTFFDYSEPERGGVPVPGASHLAASQLTLHLRWKDGKGQEQTARIEDWIHNLDRKAKLEKTPFIYTGSRIMPDGSFLATETGSLIALMVDPAAVINNPREGNELDDIWIPDPLLPAKGTEVTMELRPVAAPEKPEKPDQKKSPPAKGGRSGR
jgi:hypothetical protein